MSIRSEWVPDFRAPVRDLALGYAILLATVLVATSGPVLAAPAWLKVPVLLVLAVVTGFTWHYLVLCVHAAAHYELHPNPRINDSLGNWLGAHWVGGDVEGYREKHFAHHRLLGQASDPEGSYLPPLTGRVLFEVFFLVTPLRKVVSFYRADPMDRGTGTASSSLEWTRAARNFAAALLLNGGVAAWFAWRSALPEFLLVWLYPALFILPGLGYVRTACEHRALAADGLPVLTRNFRRDLVGFFLGSFGFDRHYWHHQNPGVHYSRLADYARAQGHPGPAPASYAGVFRRLLAEGRPATGTSP